MSSVLARGIAVLVCWTLCTDQIVEAQERSRTPAEDALSSIFSPGRAPSNKSMGLLQRSNFLDLVETTDKPLQVAIVVDGTGSMAADFDGWRRALQNMVQDLKRYKEDQVQFALVIFRDVGAESGELTIPRKTFTSDEAVLEQAFQELTPESGKPYFPELIDLGIYAGLSQLAWSTDEETSRWLIVFGDAPPYAPDFNEADTGARRRYDTDILVNLAKLKGIRINCVLCTSRADLQSVYQQAVKQTRDFMDNLASNTNGLMLDLSRPDIRQKLAEIGQQPRSKVRRVGWIRAADIRAAAEKAEKMHVSASRRIRIAVLPLLPLDQMNFEPDHPAVQVATELNQKLALLPGVEPKSPVDIELAVRRLQRKQLSGSQFLQALAVEIGVDYVVWGKLAKPNGPEGMVSALFDAKSGQKIAQSSSQQQAAVTLVSTNGNNLLLSARNALQNQNGNSALLASLAAYVEQEDLRKQFLVPVSEDRKARIKILAGLQSLEQALAYEVGSVKAESLLDAARKDLEEAVRIDTRNAFAYLLLANACYNRAQLNKHRGQVQTAQEDERLFRDYLTLAYAHRERVASASVRTEIEADYILHVKKDDYQSAIEKYQLLANAKAGPPLYTVRRAHWMLAGIYSGDWNVNPKAVDTEKARDHLIQILAHWNDSPEAEFIKRSLRWNEEKGETLFAYLTLEGAI